MGVARERDEPVRDVDRIAMLDALRGLAVLAIFAVNVKAMAATFHAYVNPDYWRGPYDAALFALLNVLVEFKFITIFSALFGAGLALVAEKADGKGVKGRLRARLFWLLVFGLWHGSLIWYGDILTNYALCGFVAALLVRKSAKTLWIIGSSLLGLGWLITLLSAGALFRPEGLSEMRAFIWDHDGETARQELEALAGGGVEQSAARAIGFGYALSYTLPLAPRTIGLMLVGAALYKSGFLRGRWTARAYARAAGVGLGLGLGLEVLRVVWLGRLGWPFAETAIIGPIGQYGASLFAAFGYAALVGWMTALGRGSTALTAAGRMAFTNYITCSLIGTTVFYGQGFGLIGQVTLTQALGLVLVTWAAILIWSPLWLARYRFGPLEWVWRSLTYGQAQPFGGRRADLAS